MIRILVWAVLAAAAAGAILVQLDGTAELAVWEILLVGLVVLQYRVIPDREDPFEKPLFSLKVDEPRRLPRDVASTELAVVDATTGYLDPNRRLRPSLKRIAEHRLSRRGVALDSTMAVEALGEEQWKTLMETGTHPVTSAQVEALVQRLEDL